MSWRPFYSLPWFDFCPNSLIDGEDRPEVLVIQV